MRKSILTILIGIGMIPSWPRLVKSALPEVFSVLLDGCVVGTISSDIMEKAVTHLRRLKLSANSMVCFL